MRSELLANVLDQVDVADFQDKNIFIQRLPHHTQSFVLHVARPPSPFILRACHGSQENTSFEWSGIVSQRVKGYWYGSY